MLGMKEKILSDNPIEQKIMTKKRFSAAVEHLAEASKLSESPCGGTLPVDPTVDGHHGALGEDRRR